MGWNLVKLPQKHLHHQSDLHRGRSGLCFSVVLWPLQKFPLWPHCPHLGRSYVKMQQKCLCQWIFAMSGRAVSLKSVDHWHLIFVQWPRLSPPAGPDKVSPMQGPSFAYAMAAQALDFVRNRLLYCPLPPLQMLQNEASIPK